MKPRKQVNLVRQLRQDHTETEEILWSKLRDRRFEGTKFRRQQQIGQYIVDFICQEEKLIIEIDGGQHNQDLKIEQDRLRSDILEKEGYKVIRFWNSDIRDNLDGVLFRIKEALDTRLHPHLNPLP